MTPKGFKFAAVEAAVKKPGRLDLGLVYCEKEATVAGVFTTNTVQAAPVVLSRKRAALGVARAVLVNSGNANACTGDQGYADAVALTNEVAALIETSPDQVLNCSTGVIGAPMPMERILKAIPNLPGALVEDPSEFSRCIMTTDTIPKVAARSISDSANSINILGVVKGAGMIRPDMATMLGFIVTDAAVGTLLLDRMLREAVEVTFNRITIDGDTSTNDTVLLMASGEAGTVKLEESQELAAKFQGALTDLCRELSRLIVKDGEGVTKVVDITVKGAASDLAAKKIAFTVGESPLVKTALHGEDPNWGRIAGAMGRSGHFAGGAFDISIGGVVLVKNSTWAGPKAENEAHAIMKRPEYEITITIYEGDCSATVTTCDFSAEYVSINADYRS